MNICDIYLDKTPDGYIFKGMRESEGASSVYSRHSIKRINKHLYGCIFDTFDDKAAQDYIRRAYGDEYGGSRPEPAPSNRLFGKRFPACTSLRCGNLFGRNFDWYYNDEVEFLVRSMKNEDNGIKHASIGVASLVPGLTAKRMEEGITEAEAALIPYLVADGINDAGLYVNINVVPAQELGKLAVKHTNPGKKRIPMTMLPKYLLDNCGSVKEAVKSMREDLDIYAVSISGETFDIHVMVGDKDGATSIVEFIDINDVIDGGSSVIEKECEGNIRPIMANFHITGTEVGDDGMIKYESLTPTGSGYERYKTAYNAIKDAITLDVVDIQKIMSDLWYSHTYTKDLNNVGFWYTEMVGHYGDLLPQYAKLENPYVAEDYWYSIRSTETGDIVYLTKRDIDIDKGYYVYTIGLEPDAEKVVSEKIDDGTLTFHDKVKYDSDTFIKNDKAIAFAVGIAKEMYAKRSRSTGDTWHTSHSCVYDLESSSMYITTQEGAEVSNMRFDLFSIFD